MSYEFFATEQNPIQAADISSSPLLSFKGILVLAIVFLVIFVLTRALGEGGANLGLVGTLLPLSAALLVGGMLIQSMVQCPSLLTEWKPVGFFSACLAASLVAAVYAHLQIFGQRL